ncbi:beta-ketoacyl-ACP synthase II [Paenibacillus radicis (ex Xue et al. 2023)]|uniref:3-oxoacyl-[acyl-carrier-protein] synthase 2 n=1 Tax=Paenibacillus radicis (ex Xue et al. 2023) TaxID=2972489 RepID=A0ABT1YLE4_9BACL|nr:beta-ketoacyl-ACP synthase II [Paenibacillus radicis (ex Xue et al. 2023)]MCR8634008.1 beta-ketoacyl-ACP synthase II [Paenibacillus radicis (ex Xue et al. 2023)]
MSRRVAVTGLGVISPLGSDVSSFWSRLVQGESGISRIEVFDPSSFATQIAGIVTDFHPEDYFEPKELRHMDRFVQFAVAAGKQALTHADLKITEQNAFRVGVSIGTGIGGIQTTLDNHKTMLEKGARRISPFLIPMMIANMGSAQLSIQIGAKGPNTTPVNACASGNNAIGEAFHLIRCGAADAMIAGGAESPVNELSFGGFCNMKAMSTRNDEPQKASRPFDANRDGFVMSEGAGVLVLEEWEHARARGATILAEIIGYGQSADAYHITAPDPEGTGNSMAMKEALRDAGVQPEEVDYINVHATGTPLGDRAEVKGIKRVFGEHAYQLKVSATKSATGHLFGAAGGLEAVITVKSLMEGIIPPTINFENPDPECDLDIVANKAEASPIQLAISNGFGFGGHNAVLVFRKA